MKSHILMGLFLMLYGNNVFACHDSNSLEQQPIDRQNIKKVEPLNDTASCSDKVSSISQERRTSSRKAISPDSLTTDTNDEQTEKADDTDSSFSFNQSSSDGLFSDVSSISSGGRILDEEDFNKALTSKFGKELDARAFEFCEVAPIIAFSHFICTKFQREGIKRDRENIIFGIFHKQPPKKVAIEESFVFNLKKYSEEEEQRKEKRLLKSTLARTPVGFEPISTQTTSLSSSVISVPVVLTRKALSKDISPITVYDIERQVAELFVLYNNHFAIKYKKFLAGIMLLKHALKSKNTRSVLCSTKNFQMLLIMALNCLDAIPIARIAFYTKKQKLSNKKIQRAHWRCAKENAHEYSSTASVNDSIVFDSDNSSSADYYFTESSESINADSLQRIKTYRKKKISDFSHILEVKLHDINIQRERIFKHRLHPELEHYFVNSVYPLSFHFFDQYLEHSPEFAKVQQRIIKYIDCPTKPKAIMTVREVIAGLIGSLHKHWTLPTIVMTYTNSQSPSVASESTPPPLSDPESEISPASSTSPSSDMTESFSEERFHSLLIQKISHRYSMSEYSMVSHPIIFANVFYDNLKINRNRSAYKLFSHARKEKLLIPFITTLFTRYNNNYFQMGGSNFLFGFLIFQEYLEKAKLSMNSFSIFKANLIASINFVFSITSKKFDRTNIFRINQYMDLINQEDVVPSVRRSLELSIKSTMSSTKIDDSYLMRLLPLQLRAIRYASSHKILSKQALYNAENAFEIALNNVQKVIAYIYNGNKQEKKNGIFFNIKKMF